MLWRVTYQSEKALTESWLTKERNKIYMEEREKYISLFKEFPEKEKKKSNLIGPRKHNSVLNFEFQFINAV